MEYFLYRSWIALISGATFCIFSMARMLFDLSGNITMIDQDGDRSTMSQP